MEIVKVLGNDVYYFDNEEYALACEKAYKSGRMQIVKSSCTGSFWWRQKEIVVFILSEEKIDVLEHGLNELDDWSKKMKKGTKICMEDPSNDWLEFDGTEWVECEPPYKSHVK